MHERWGSPGEGPVKVRSGQIVILESSRTVRGWHVTSREDEASTLLVSPVVAADMLLWL